jgi:hypothetical protein
LESYFQRLEGKHLVRVVCIDLASAYRALVRRHFPQGVIGDDRFHVIRLVNQHFLALWRQQDSAGARNRGLLSLLRRHAVPGGRSPMQRPYSAVQQEVRTPRLSAFTVTHITVTARSGSSRSIFQHPVES